MCSLPEDMGVLHRKLPKTVKTRLNSAALSRKDYVKAILKFVQVELESKKKSLVLCDKPTFRRCQQPYCDITSANFPTSAGRRFVSARWQFTHPGQTMCPLCDIRATARPLKHPPKSAAGSQSGKRGHIARFIRNTAVSLPLRLRRRHDDNALFPTTNIHNLRFEVPTRQKNQEKGHPTSS